jgi:hypothetical protein
MRRERNAIAIKCFDFIVVLLGNSPAGREQPQAALRNGPQGDDYFLQPNFWSIRPLGQGDEAALWLVER